VEEVSTLKLELDTTWFVNTTETVDTTEILSQKSVGILSCAFITL
jgi:hypothetical protein